MATAEKSANRSSETSIMILRCQLLRLVWGRDAHGHLVEVHMSSLRRKLEAHGPRMIETVRGTGYVLRS